MRPFVLGSAAVLLLALAGCSESQARSGPEVSRNFAVGPFSAIEVRGPYDVVVTTGKPTAVSARGTQRLIEGLIVEARDGKLIIRPEQSDGRGGWNGNRSWARISVSAPTLSAISVAGSGDTSIDRIVTERFTGAIAGSGDLSLGQVAVRELKLAVAGSGGVKAAGRADTVNYSVAGSGELDARELSATQASVSAAGSGSIRARVTGNANASVVGSGNIDIVGGARCQQSTHGSGSVRCS